MQGQHKQPKERERLNTQETNTITALKKQNRVNVIPRDGQADEVLARPAERVVDHERHHRCTHDTAVVLSLEAIQKNKIRQHEAIESDVDYNTNEHKAAQQSADST